MDKEEIKKLAEDYYYFIIKIKNYYSKYHKADNNENEPKKICQEYIDVIFKPCLELTKGKEIEELIKRFTISITMTNKYLDMSRYLRIEQSYLREEELKQYYKKQGIEKTEDEIMNEKYKVDINIYSNRIIELDNIEKEIDSSRIMYRLYDLYKKEFKFLINTRKRLYIE